jgi:hypothetical protein
VFLTALVFQEQGGPKWALEMKNLLETVKREVTDAGGALEAEKIQRSDKNGN